MIALWALVALFQMELPGTQPGDLSVRLSAPSSCHNCHRGFEGSAGDTWAGSMMANAARDPLYLATLAIANQDVADSGELCIRCHSPRGWLSGRSEPPDGSALDRVDRASGVDCDFCHRLIDGPQDDGSGLIGNAQYFVVDEAVTYGRYRDTMAQHGVATNDYITSSALCGLCHDVTNPISDFPIERTYTEWLNSAYWDEGEGCIDCHMRPIQGQIAVGDGLPIRDLHSHELAGGNAWTPLVLATLYPEDAPALRHAAERARAMLASAATVEIETPPSTSWGGVFDFTVRVTNESGHKLPTGYPEGRRCWLEVEVTDATGQVLLHSGAYDEMQADRIDDPQLRTYEARLNQGGNHETFHFMLQDTRLLDDRIPPRGFRPNADTVPVGREYPEQPDGTLAHWDDAPYRVMLPEDTPGPLTIRATLRYQTTSRAYVEFLRDANVTNDAGQELWDLWNAHGRSPPETIDADQAEVTLTPPPEPEPEPQPVPEPVPDAMPQPTPEPSPPEQEPTAPASGGCAVIPGAVTPGAVTPGAVTQGPGPLWPGVLALALAGRLARRRIG